MVFVFAWASFLFSLGVLLVFAVEFNRISKRKGEAMSEFSDEDLQYLKNKSLEDYLWVPVGKGHDKNIRLLLARLEAAEKLALKLHLALCSGCACKLCEAWRKAAGRE